MSRFFRGTSGPDFDGIAERFSLELNVRREGCDDSKKVVRGRELEDRLPVEIDGLSLTGCPIVAQSRDTSLDTPRDRRISNDMISDSKDVRGRVLERSPVDIEGRIFTGFPKVAKPDGNSLGFRLSTDFTSGLPVASASRREADTRSGKLLTRSFAWRRFIGFSPGVFADFDGRRGEDNRWKILFIQ